jgi:hypothetical protein
MNQLLEAATMTMIMLHYSGQTASLAAMVIKITLFSLSLHDTPAAVNRRSQLQHILSAYVAGHAQARF